MASKFLMMIFHLFLVHFVKDVLLSDVNNSLTTKMAVSESESDSEIYMPCSDNYTRTGSDITPANTQFLTTKKKELEKALDYEVISSNQFNYEADEDEMIENLNPPDSEVITSSSIRNNFSSVMNVDAKVKEEEMDNFSFHLSSVGEPLKSGEISSIVNENENEEDSEVDEENASKSLCDFDSKIEMMASQDESESSQIKPYFRHRTGIKNVALNCYASAIINCLYSNPVFHEALFQEATDLLSNPNAIKWNSVTIALAAVFRQLRENVSPINLKNFFFSAVEHNFSWEFGTIQCVIEFWNSMWLTFPSRMRSLFEIEIVETHHRRSDGAAIKSRIVKEGIIIVTPGSKFLKISSFIDNNFRDDDAEPYKVKASEKDEYKHVLSETELAEDSDISIPSFTTTQIVNTPEILTFGVRRLLWNKQTATLKYNFEPLEFSETIIVNGVSYTNLASVEFSKERTHYFANVQDFLNRNWYTHDDEDVFLVPDTDESITELSERLFTKATLFFFVKTSALELFKMIPLPEISELLKSRFRVRKSFSGAADTDPTVTSEKLERSRTSNRKRKVKTIYSDDAFNEKSRRRSSKTIGEVIIDDDSDAEEKTKNKVESVVIDEKFKKQKRIKSIKDGVDYFVADETDEPSEAQNRYFTRNSLQISLQNKPKFRMNRKPLSSDNNLLFAEEGYLGIRKFSLRTSPETQILEHFLFVLSQNPTASKALFKFIQNNPEVRDVRFTFAKIITKILIGSVSIDITELKQQLVNEHEINLNGSIREVWNTIMAILPENISPISKVKTIFYEQDEPMEFHESNQNDIESELVANKSCECPRDLGIVGLFFDEIVNFEENHFNRKIVRPNNGIILPIHIKRYSEGKFMSNQIEIGFDRNNVKFYCPAITCSIPEITSKLITFYFTGDSFTMFWDGTAKSVQITNSKIAERIKMISNRYSHLIYYSPVGYFNSPPVQSSDIPDSVVRELDI